MLDIDDLTIRMGRRVLLDQASASIADGWKVGLVGRNGTGKSTLLRHIAEEAGKGGGAIRLKRGARMGFVAQEVAAEDTPMLDLVLAADTERAALMAEAETATDPDRIGEIHARLTDIDAWSAEARAGEILTGLGFAHERLRDPARSFSGGWRMRAALAGVLVSAPDLLVLDEPTNYLDLEGAAWLEGHLKTYPHTVLVVSHDRDMLNRSVTHILALEHAKLELHPGGYDNWLRKRAERAASLAGLKAKQDAQRAHLQAFVDRFRAKASKAKQAQSRIKMLERMQDIALPVSERTTPFQFEPPEELASPLVELDGADLGYAAGRPVLRSVGFRLDHDDRIVVIGPNGQGKTTLVKSLGGQLPLLSGARRASKALRIGYFSQDQMDELVAGDSVLAHVRALEPDLSEARLRSLAAQMGFGPDKADTLVERLSGGEKVRLLLGLLAHRKPHVLILDEPTSHLDIDSREALILAINDFPGAVVLITHDSWLAEACAERLWLVHGGRASVYDGDLSGYRSLVLTAERAPAEPSSARSGAAASGKSDRQDAAARRQALGPLRKAVSEAEKRMAREGDAIGALDAQLADPDLYVRDPRAAAALSTRRAAHVAALAQAEEDWLEASEALASAQ